MPEISHGLGLEKSPFIVKAFHTVILFYFNEAAKTTWNIYLDRMPRRDLSVFSK